MWWKIYLIINVLAVVLSAFFVLGELPQSFPLLFFQTITYGISVYGLYIYLQKQSVFSQQTWLGILVANLVFEVLYIIYTLYPTFSLLASFTEVGEDAVGFALAGLIFSAPLYYTTYQLSRGKVYEPKAKKELHPYWGLLQIALWGYATVLTAVSFMLGLLPSAASESANDPLTGILIYGPILFFWIMVVLQRKEYVWNWWKKGLVTTSVIWSVIFIAGLFNTEQMTGELTLLDYVPLPTMFATLIVLGRDRLVPLAVPTKQEDKN
jgi:hypothetical protein